MRTRRCSVNSTLALQTMMWSWAMASWVTSGQKSSPGMIQDYWIIPCNKFHLGTDEWFHLHCMVMQCPSPRLANQEASQWRSTAHPAYLQLGTQEPWRCSTLAFLIIPKWGLGRWTPCSSSGVLCYGHFIGLSRGVADPWPWGCTIPQWIHSIAEGRNTSGRGVQACHLEPQGWLGPFPQSIWSQVLQQQHPRWVLRSQQRCHCQHDIQIFWDRCSMEVQGFFINVMEDAMPNIALHLWIDLPFSPQHWAWWAPHHTLRHIPIHVGLCADRAHLLDHARSTHRKHEGCVGEGLCLLQRAHHQDTVQQLEVQLISRISMAIPSSRVRGLRSKTWCQHD